MASENINNLFNAFLTLPDEEKAELFDMIMSHIESSSNEFHDEEFEDDLDDDLDDGLEDEENPDSWDDED